MFDPAVGLGAPVPYTPECFVTLSVYRTSLWEWIHAAIGKQTDTSNQQQSHTNS